MFQLSKKFYCNAITLDKALSIVIKGYNDGSSGRSLLHKDAVDYSLHVKKSENKHIVIPPVFILNVPPTYLILKIDRDESEKTCTIKLSYGLNWLILGFLILLPIFGVLMSLIINEPFVVSRMNGNEQHPPLGLGFSIGSLVVLLYTVAFHFRKSRTLFNKIDKVLQSSALSAGKTHSISTQKHEKL